MTTAVRTSPKTSVIVLGVHLSSPAYPNTQFVIEGLRHVDAVACREINTPMRSAPGFTAARSNFRWLKPVVSLLRAIHSHLSVLLRYALARKGDVVYVPYPAVGILFLFSLLPRGWRPRRLVADAFISIYDTAVIDRQLLSKTSRAARLLHRIERRAYQTATLIVVDTEDNLRYYAEMFQLPKSGFTAVPLATDEAHFAASDYKPSDGQCRVLFVGTFVPLQGTDIIAGAILKLQERSDIRFTILGAGQSAAGFAEILGDPPPASVSWITDWQESESVANAIKTADICLGIFSSGPKAQRVWPFKNYAYLACGRPVITADTDCARRMLELSGHPAFVTVPAGDAAGLAAKIIELADSPERRQALALEARRFYESHLSNSVARARLLEVIVAG